MGPAAACLGLSFLSSASSDGHVPYSRLPWCGVEGYAFYQNFPGLLFLPIGACFSQSPRDPLLVLEGLASFLYSPPSPFLFAPHFILSFPCIPTSPSFPNISPLLPLVSFCLILPFLPFSSSLNPSPPSFSPAQLLPSLGQPLSTLRKYIHLLLVTFIFHFPLWRQPQDLSHHHSAQTLRCIP